MLSGGEGLMEFIFLIALLLILGAGVFSLIRACLGPSWFDRILAANSFTTKSILFIAVYFFAMGQPEYIDIALLYALINYVATLALVNFFNRSRGAEHG